MALMGSILNQTIENAENHNDLQNILNKIELSELKSFLKQQIRNKNQEEVTKYYYGTRDIVDIFGKDILKEVLTYLSIQELHKFKVTSNSMQKMINELLSSDKLYKYLIKSKQDKSIVDFQNWIEERENWDDVIEAQNNSHIAFFLLEEKYKEWNYNSNELYGKDLILIKCLKILGYDIENIQHIAIPYGLTEAAQSKEVFVGYYGDSSYIKSSDMIQGVGFIDINRNGKVVEHTVTRWEWSGDAYVCPIYHAISVDVDAA